MKTSEIETTVSATPAHTIDAAQLEALGGRSQLRARMMRTGVRAGASATGDIEQPALRFATVGVGEVSTKLRFA